MNILLTGSTGFVGKHLLRRLEAGGHNVTQFYRDTSLIPELWDDPIDAIINCAGEITNQHKMFEANVDLVERLLTFAQRAKVGKFIQIGSSSEYGNVGLARREDMNCIPTDLYSATKLAATNLCLGFAHQYDMDICVARPFSLYGPDDTPRKLIPRLIASLRGGEPVRVTRNGKQDYLHVNDFTQGLSILLNASSKMTKGDIVNFGSGESSSNQEVVRIIGHVCRTPIHEWIDGGKTHDWVADTKKAFTKYGWQSETSLEFGIRSLCNEVT